MLQVDSYGVACDTGCLLSYVGLCWQRLRMLEVPAKDKLRYVRIGSKYGLNLYVLGYGMTDTSNVVRFMGQGMLGFANCVFV